MNLLNPGHFIGFQLLILFLQLRWAGIKSWTGCTWHPPGRSLPMHFQNTTWLTPNYCVCPPSNVALQLHARDRDTRHRIAQSANRKLFQLQLLSAGSLCLKSGGEEGGLTALERESQVGLRRKQIHYSYAKRMYISCPMQWTKTWEMWCEFVSRCVWCGVAVYINAVWAFIPCFNTAFSGALFGKGQRMCNKKLALAADCGLFTTNNFPVDQRERPIKYNSPQ